MSHKILVTSGSENQSNHAFDNLGSSTQRHHAVRHQAENRDPSHYNAPTWSGEIRSNFDTTVTTRACPPTIEDSRRKQFYMNTKPNQGQGMKTHRVSGISGSVLQSQRTAPVSLGNEFQSQDLTGIFHKTGGGIESNRNTPHSPLRAVTRQTLLNYRDQTLKG